MGGTMDKKTFTFATKAGCKKIFFAALCAILVFSFCAQLISSDFGKVKVTDVTLDIRGGALNGDLYYPSGTDANDSLPAIIVNHGGGVVKGVMKGICEELARRGFVVFNVNDYNQGLSDMPDVLEYSPNPANGASLVDAIDYVRTLKFVDTTRIGLVGHSMGSRRAGLAAIQDVGCYSLNDLLLNELYDSFGVTISAEEVNTPADEIAEAQLDAEQMEYYQYRKAELTEYYNTRVSAVCLMGSNADLITSLQTVEVAGHEVQRNYQTNIGIIDGDFDVDYYTYPSMDFARESWYTGEEDILVDQYYLLDDATQTSQALWDFHANHYGDEAFADAVSQRMLRSITFNPETHSKNFFSLASSTDVTRFFTNVFQYNCGELSTAAGGIDVTQNVWQYRAVLICLAMFAMIVMVLALYGWLTKDKESYLSGAVVAAVERGPVNKKVYWGGTILGAITTFVAIYVAGAPAKGGSAPLAMPAGWRLFPLMSTADYTLAFLRWLTLFAVILVVIYLIYEKKTTGAFGLKKLNLVINIKSILKNLLVTVAVVIVAYISLSAILYLFNQDYRLWELSFTKMKVENWGIALRYAILFLPTYLAIGCMINYTLRTDWPEWKDDLITVVMGSVGVWVCCLLNAIIINTAWSGQLFCDFKCLYSVLLFVPISIYISRKLYRLTNTVWSGAFCNAILLSWCIVAATGLSNYPQTWFSNFFGV